MKSGVDSTIGDVGGVGVTAAVSTTTQYEPYADQPSLDTPPTGVILQGDCVELMRALPEESIRMVVTSPPYNIKNSTGNGLKDGRGGKWPTAALQKGYSEHDDCMPHDEYVDWQRECLAGMMRVLRPDGAIFYNHKWRVQNGLLQDRHDIVDGFPVRQIIIWQRAGGINFNPRLLSAQLRGDLPDRQAGIPTGAQGERIRQRVEHQAGA